MIVYISIGNSDDKLTQADWAEYCAQTAAQVTEYAATIHGTWFSVPSEPWQNACWAAEFDTGADAQALRRVLADLCAQYRQDSIAWAEARTEFITPDLAAR